MRDILSDRNYITSELSKMLEKYINPHNDTRIYWAKEVTFDYGTNQQIRVDYMRFRPKNNSVSGIEKGDFYCFEIKSCIEDFNSKHGHNFIGDLNYYVMENQLYDRIKDKIPYKIGVLIPQSSTLIVAKKAKRVDRKRPMSEMLLMMFRSANRDRKR